MRITWLRRNPRATLLRGKEWSPVVLGHCCNYTSGIHQQWPRTKQPSLQRGQHELERGAEQQEQWGSSGSRAEWDHRKEEASAVWNVIHCNNLTRSSGRLGGAMVALSMGYLHKSHDRNFTTRECFAECQMTILWALPVRVQGLSCAAQTARQGILTS